MKFFERFLKNQVKVEDIHKYIDEWHDANTNEKVYEYLGMTEDQYEIFIRYPEKAKNLRNKNLAASSYTQKNKLLSALKKIISFKKD